ncbi:MAG TPA: hypothetical protein PLM79_12120 [Syntrophobacteraceae bacterium]|nr:hypothetical protein [Syntrophobacteraceae bacterium]
MGRLCSNPLSAVLAPAFLVLALTGCKSGGRVRMRFLEETRK